MPAIQTDTEVRFRTMRMVSRVLSVGREHHLFGDEAHGWFTVFTRQGEPVCDTGTGLLKVSTLNLRNHAEEQVQWLVSQNQLTSRGRQGCDTGDIQAVAITGTDFYFGYASFAKRVWAEAILVVTAIRLKQFSTADLLKEELGFRSNPHIGELLRVACWNE